MSCESTTELVGICSEKGETECDFSSNFYVRITDHVYMKIMHVF